MRTLIRIPFGFPFLKRQLCFPRHCRFNTARTRCNRRARSYGPGARSYGGPEARRPGGPAVARPEVRTNKKWTRSAWALGFPSFQAEAPALDDTSASRKNVASRSTDSTAQDNNRQQQTLDWPTSPSCSSSSLQDNRGWHRAHKPFV